MLERYKEGIEVKVDQHDDKEKRNQKRNAAIEDHFKNHFTLDKNSFSKYVQHNKLAIKDKGLLEKVKTMDFKNANPQNTHFMNELTFAGGAITEGFLDCFNIERNKSLEKYKAQLQVIERKENGKNPEYFIGTFEKDTLLRLSPYQERKDQFIELVNEKEKQRLNGTRQQTKEQISDKNLGLIRKREEEK